MLFVHAWSVKGTDTYGELPERLVSEARKQGWFLDARHVFLGKYVSFSDEVTGTISRADSNMLCVWN